MTRRVLQLQKYEKSAGGERKVGGTTLLGGTVGVNA